MTTALTLHIGNKNYSSWSLRPWLALKWAGIDFAEHVIPLDAVGYGKSKIAAILAVSPSGRVPALHVHTATGDRVIHDSLAISEWAAEEKPAAHLWPDDRLTRAECRAATAEMHSSFAELRRAMPFNLRRRAAPRAWSDAVQGDIARITELWTATRGQYGSQGPWLYGTRSIADAFYAPVCTRFRTYGVSLPKVCAEYSETLFADAHFREWERAAVAESWTIPSADNA